MLLLPMTVLCLSAMAGVWHPHLLFWKKKKTVVKTETVVKKTEYEKLFGKGDKVAKGFITLHQKDGKVYFEMPLRLFGRQMLLGSTITSVSDNGNGIVGSKPASPLLIRFTRNKTSVQLRQVDNSFVTQDDAIDSAFLKSHTDIILANPKIVAWNKDSTNVVFDMTSFFVSDNKKMPVFDDNSVYSSGYSRTTSFRSDCSYLSGIKAFSDNISVKSVLSYTFSLTKNGSQALKDQPFTAEVTRSIMLLKDKPYKPRMADYRIGYFFTERQQLNPSPRTSLPVYYTNRWDLQPRDTAAWLRGEVVEVTKPVVFYIDNTFPEKWRPAIKEAVSQWSQVFESECRLKNAVVAKDFPTDDPEFDPDNIKYNCIRYAPISIRNAMGPSWVDPRSGEILMASVYVYHDFIKLIRDWLFVQTAAADPDVRTNEMPEPVMNDAIRYVIGHEVGHCLGLMHNMGASNNVPVDSLRSPAYTQKYGTTPSIMDYARFNYVAQPGDKERGVRLTPPRFGVYDRYAIKWGYTPVFGKTADEEARYMEKWITDSLRKSPLYRYGKQQFFMPFPDPRSMNEDLGDDAVKATKYGIRNLKYIMGHMDAWLGSKDKDMSYRSELLQQMIQQYALYTIHVASNVSGYYLNETKEGDGQTHLRGLDKARQEASLRYLFTMYKDLDWMDNKTLLSKMTLSGSPATTMRKYVSRFIISAPLDVSCYNGIDKKSLQPDEALDMVFKFVWEPTVKGRSLTEWERTLQEAYVGNLLQNSGFKVPKGFGAAALNSGADMDMPLQSVCSPLSIGGFEQIPRSIFNSPSLTQADMYALLQKARRLILAKRNTGNAETKAHYTYLLRVIANLTK